MISVQVGQVQNKLEDKAAVALYLDLERALSAKGLLPSPQSPKPKSKREYLTPDDRKRRLNEMKQAAIALGGSCLSEEYIHCNTPLLFSCPIHGEFLAKPSKVADGHWCRRCPIERARVDLAKRIAAYLALKGGTLLNDVVNARTKLLVRCSFGHEWTPLPDNMLNKQTWCPYCVRSLPRPGRKKKTHARVPVLI